MSYVVHYEGLFLRKKRTPGSWGVTADVEMATPCDTPGQAEAMARQCVNEVVGTPPAKLAQNARVEHTDEFKIFTPKF